MKFYRLAIQPQSLASPSRCEELRKWLDRKKYNDIVLDRPGLLSKEELKELEDLGVKFYWEEVRK